mmetsp:Transcript_4567/g.10065  ORF Transcript_4567/g.10065 Transcript_4567/m.10065 type:complete len:421 (+) Transcript_4567:43-1305(+)
MGTSNVVACPVTGTDALACVICGTDEKVSTCESWVGSFHSACNHAYCSTCLEKHINAHITHCYDEQHLTVYCCSTDCPKRIPQKMVLGTSIEARMMANAIDLGKKRGTCQHCKSPAPWRRIITNSTCAHGACTQCWSTWMSQCLPAMVEGQALDIPCIDSTCAQGCRSVLNHPEIGPDVSSCNFLRYVQSHLTHMDFELRRLKQINTVTSRLKVASGGLVRAVVERTDRFQGPTCPICRRTVVALISDPDCPHHGACEVCWVRWAELQLDVCVAHRRLEACCMWPECATCLGTHLGLWYQAASLSKPIQQLTRLLERRAQLQRSVFYPAPMQVECPKLGCVGIGYLGFESVMCFLCEHLWLPEESGEQPGIPDVEKVMGIAVKKCPECKEYIEKNGGCDHMTCLCKHEFHWSTLKPYRPG